MTLKSFQSTIGFKRVATFENESVCTVCVVYSLHCDCGLQPSATREICMARAWIFGPSDAIREEFFHNGNYITANNLPLAFDVWRDKAFFTVPRCVREIISISCLKFMTTFNTINYWQSLMLHFTCLANWRWKTGVVSSLNYVEFTADTKTPILHPYPNFDVNQLSNDNETTIVSAFGLKGNEK